MGPQYITGVRLYLVNTIESGVLGLALSDFGKIDRGEISHSKNRLSAVLRHCSYCTFWTFVKYGRNGSFEEQGLPHIRGLTETILKVGNYVCTYGSTVRPPVHVQWKASLSFYRKPYLSERYF